MMTNKAYVVEREHPH